jgi:peptide/nickel transport system permease protein
MLLVSIIVFLMVHIVPGDPARILLGQRASVENVEALRVALGFDRPLPVQYWEFITDAVRGDFGESIRARRPALDLVLEALPATILLIGSALLVAFSLGIPLGVLAAVRRGGFIDKTLLGISLIGQSVPAFWVGLLLISFVSLRWGLLPTSGYGGIEHLILPMCSLVLFVFAMIMRVTRVSVIEVLNEDYVRTARAKGLPSRVVIGKHAFKNALIPVITLMGLQIGALLGGAIITETVFAWPGIGRLAVNALSVRDWPVVRTIILITALGLVVINIVVDIIYSIIDKRIRFV